MIFAFEGLYICDRPRRPGHDVEFWEEYREWMAQLSENQRPFHCNQHDVIFVDEKAAVLYALRWHGQP